MNIQNISFIVSELLQTNECVTIPGFGAFVVNPASATIDMAKNRFTPPGKRVSFNKNITNNDGLLASAFAEREGISYEDAVVYLNGVTAHINTELSEKFVFDFFLVGTFFLSTEGIMRFEPKELDSMDSVGLSAFHLSPLEGTPFIGKEIISAHKENAKPEIQYVQTTSKWGKVALGVALIPIAAYLIWIPTGSGALDKEKGFQLSSLNPFGTTPCAEYVARPMTSAFVIEQGEDAYADIDTESLKFAVAETTNVVEEKTAVETRLSYYIIGGCFSSRSNADRLVANLQSNGYAAQILDKKNGLYRVTYGGYTHSKDARKALRKIKANDNTSAWLFKAN